MKMMAVILLSALLLCGCAGGQVKRVYSVNAAGYSSTAGKSLAEAKKEAETAARENAVEAVSRFLEYRLPVSSETRQLIIHGAKVTGSRTGDGTASATVSYDFDLFEFVGKNYDMKDYAAWELLGLENYYSDYARSAKPIGIWIQQKVSEERDRNPYAYASLSFLPVFSGNFVVNKNVMGGFFTAGKSASLLTVLCNDKQPVKITAGVVLVLLTAADFYSVCRESSASVEKLESLQNAVLTDSGFSVELFSAKFQ